MWRARKYPDCKTWTVFDDAGGGTIASKMTEANAVLVASLKNDNDALRQLFNENPSASWAKVEKLERENADLKADNGRLEGKT